MSRTAEKMLAEYRALTQDRMARDMDQWVRGGEEIKYYERVKMLMNDGISMQWRFMNGHECAAWIVNNRDTLIALLTEKDLREIDSSAWTGRPT